MKKNNMTLRKLLNDDRLKFYLGDIRSYSSVLEAAKDQIIFFMLQH